MKRYCLFLCTLFLCLPIFAQPFRFNYSHDTLGNRISRVYQGVVPAKGISVIAENKEAFDGDSIISKEPDEAKVLSIATPPAIYDTLMRGPLAKTMAEKETFLKAILDEVVGLQPLPAERGARSLNDFSVGEIPLSYGVSGTGARTYSVPILTAPDIKYAPSLSLVYNSQGGYGYAGFGWALSGLSTITLTGKTQYWDGEIKAPSCSDTDGVFCLDGVRLVTNNDSVTSGIFPLVTATGHILVAPHRNNSGYITSFTAKFPDGTTAIYGTESDRNFTIPVFPVIRTINLEGEKIEYDYTYNATDPQDVRPTLSSVRYGFDSAGTASAHINLSYWVSYSIFGYSAGKKISRPPVISTISSYSGGTRLYFYDMSYQHKTDTELLTAISLKNSSGGELPTLSFSYGANDPELAVSDSLTYLGGCFLTDAFPPDSLAVCRRGKFVRGSYDDGLLAYERHPIYTETNLIRHYACNYDSTLHLLFAHHLSTSGFSQVVDTIAVGNGFQTAEAVDIDGDGLEEIVKVCCTETYSAGSVYNIRVYRSDSYGQAVLSSSRDIFLDGVLDINGEHYPYNRSYRWGDFTGDGKAELLIINYSDNGYGEPQTPAMALIDLNTGLKISDGVYFSPFTPQTDRRLLCTDIDGDGSTEICCTFGSEMRTYHWSNGYFLPSATYSGITSGIIDSDDTYYTDINADGYLDIIKASTTGTSWSVYINTGDGFASSSVTLYQKSSGDRVMFMDIDRDGYPDMLTLRGSELGYFRNRDGFRFNFYKRSFEQFPLSASILPSNVMDHSSPSSFVVLYGRIAASVGFSVYTPTLRHLLQSRDSYGKIVRNTYQYLPQASLYFTENPSYINNADGYQLRVLPIYVLKGAKGWLAPTDTTTVFLRETYSWYDGVVHTQGLGFCGFSKTRVESVLDTIHHITASRFNPQKRGVPVSTSHYLGSDGTPPYQATEFEYDSIVTTYGKLQPRILRSSVTKSLDGVLSTTSYTYSQSDFDFPVGTRTTRYATGMLSASDSTLTVYQHSNNPLRYVLGVITSKTTLHDRNGDGNFKMGERTAFSLDTLCRPLVRHSCRLEIPHGASQHQEHPVSTDRWTYDSRGNVIREESAPAGSAVFIGTSYSYDSSGRHLVSSTDALGHTTSYSSFDIYGNPAIVTNYKGQQTHTYRDGWGRTTRTVHPDGTVDSLARTWGGLGVYTETAISTGSPDAIVEYDAAGRRVASSQKRFDGQWQKVRTGYNERGLAARVSVPYRGSSPQHWNTYAYDAWGRTVSLSEDSGRQSAWSYEGTAVTETKEGVAITRRTYPSGDLWSVTDAGGSVYYHYRDDGLPSRVGKTNLTSTLFSYDTLGRRTSIIDPSAGVRSTTYQTNADGFSAVTETNAHGSIATTCDSLGRVVSIARPDFSTVYSYDTCGRMVSAVSTNGTSSRYTYDDYDRIVTARDSVPDGKWLQKTYAYNADGQVASIAYTSQGGYITTETYFYTNGYNTSITLPDNTVVFSLTSENDLGQPTAATSGSVSRTYGYTDYGLPTFRKLAGGVLQDFSYTFDAATGNLTSRSFKHFKKTVSESFTYDNLGRLTSAGGNAISYDTDNNITSLGGVGAMSYQDPGHLNAISDLQAASDDIVATASETISYTAYDRPSSITFTGKTTTFTYNSAHDRVKMQRQAGFGDYVTRYYIGGRYELETDQEHSSTAQLLFLGGDAYSAPMALKKVDDGSWTPYVIGRDYLGSITHIITTSGTIVNEYNYDAWGRMRNFFTLEPFDCYDQPTLFLGRGWGGHEHLPMFGLYNLNARLYDPVLGRFLSPDPYIQAPDNPANFNRYAYCLNNPLKYRDISGEFFTWNIGRSSFSAGINFSPWRIPLGCGVSVSWEDGLFMGVYGELGYRIGGSGIGAGATINYTYGFNYKYGQWGGSVNAGVYGSFGPLTMSISMSYAGGQTGGSLCLGLGYGDGISGIGGSVGYGSSGYTFGAGGYIDKRAAVAFCENLQLLMPEGTTTVTKSDSFLRQAQKLWYPDAPMSNILGFSYEKPSPRAISLFRENPGRLAVTIPRQKITGELAEYVSIYFNDGAFDDIRTLYAVMGHEFVHTCNYITAAQHHYSLDVINSKAYNEMTEYWAYSFQAEYTGSTMNSFDIEQIISSFGDDFANFNYHLMPWYNTRNPVY